MSYQSTITKKGQVTVPKKVREALGLRPYSRVVLELSGDKKTAELRPAPDIVDIAGSFKVKKPVSALKTRKKMEKSYKRF